MSHTVATDWSGQTTHTPSQTSHFSAKLVSTWIKCLILFLFPKAGKTEHRIRSRLHSYKSAVQGQRLINHGTVNQET